MASTISVFNNSGRKLAEIEADFKRSWKLCEYGSGSFEVAISDLKTKLEYLQFGNFVYVEHPKLPPWAGMIDVPRTWNKKSVVVNCYSGEYLLCNRIMPRELIVGGTKGTLFKALIENMENDAPHTVPVLAGDVWDGGGSTKMICHYEMAYNKMIDLLNVIGGEYQIVPAFDAGGNLYFLANFANLIGATDPFVLYEDHIELKDDVITEQGNIYNHVVSFGGGSTYWTIIAEKYRDENSIATYGYRSLAVNIGGNDVKAIADGGQTALEKSKNPRTTFALNVLDVGDAFYKTRVGNILSLELVNYGFTGGEIGISTKIRIMQMSYNDLTNKVSIVADEYKG